MAQTAKGIEGRGIAARHQGPLPVNVNEMERIASGVWGAGLFLAALGRGPVGALVFGLAGGALVHRAVTGHCRAYGALGIDTTERRPATSVPAQQGYRVEKSVVVDRPVEDVYHAWEDIEDLPGIMQHLVSVQRIDGNRSRWVAKGPLDTTLEWEAEVILQRENGMISWRSLPGSQVETAGSVHFKPVNDGRSTEVRVNLKYNPPAGRIGASIASFLGQGLEQELGEDLQRFKEAMELGQGASLETLAGGRNGGTTLA